MNIGDKVKIKPVPREKGGHLAWHECVGMTGIVEHIESWKGAKYVHVRLAKAIWGADMWGFRDTALEIINEGTLIYVG